MIKETKKIIQTSKSNSKSTNENKKATDNEIKKNDKNLIMRPRAVSENREISLKVDRETDRDRRSVSMSKTLTGSKSEAREDKKKATMVVRLHPGQHQKISANSQNKVNRTRQCQWQFDRLTDKHIEIATFIHILEEESKK